MTDTLSNPASSAPSPISSKEVVEWVQATGQALNMTLLYGPRHKVAQTSIDRSYPVVTSLIERYGSLHISIAEADLLVNGTSAQGAPLTGNLVTRLTSRNLLSFTMEAGLTLEEYHSFFALLVAPAAAADATSPESGTTGLLTGIEHIAAQNVTYRRVVEGEADSAGEPAAGSENSITVPADLANVVAFLRGDPSAIHDRGREDLRQLAEDAEKLAELVLRSANIREQAADLGSGESLTDLVVGCINRLTDALAQSPAAKTQKGRKQAKRTLLLLEEKLLAQLHAMAGDTTDRAAVEAAFAEATEDLDVESLTAKYMKSRRAAEKAESRMRRLIERVGDDPAEENELRERLMDQGLTPEGWEELMLSREVSEGAASPPGSEIQEIKTLTLLLAQLGETLTQPRSPSSEPAEAKLQALITETGEQMQTLATGTEKKIAALQTMAAAPPEGSASGKPERLTRKALLEMLAEIAQELSQPLTIINATLDMLRGQRSGPVTPTQEELLTLAAESGSRLGHLVVCLMKVAGTPAGLRPDHKILSEAYRAGGAPSVS